MSSLVRAPVFVDTSVLLYARDASESEKQLRADEWMVHLWRTRTGRLSHQVLAEFYETVTRLLDPGLPVATAREEVRNFLAWRPIPVDRTVLEGAWAVEGRHGLSFRDATIVAAAQLTSSRFLLTERLRHGLELGGVEVVNPFENMPEVSTVNEGR